MMPSNFCASVQYTDIQTFLSFNSDRINMDLEVARATLLDLIENSIWEGFSRASLIQTSKWLQAAGSPMFI